MNLTDEIRIEIEYQRDFAGEDNWDSYDAPAITEEEIAWSYHVIEQLPELGNDVSYNFSPSSVEINWGPIDLWFTLNFRNDGKTGVLAALESHDPHDTRYIKHEKEIEDANILEYGTWFAETRQRLEKMSDDFIIEFEKWSEVEHIEKVFDVGSFKPFTYFVTMVPTWKFPSTGFIWQNFRASNAFSTDPVKRCFFQNVQIINTRILPRLDKSGTT